MLKISGTLSIRSIKGSKGAFNVGRLITEIGEFAVKDALIEEYEEGRYDGEFGILSIFPTTYSAYGRTVVEVRARLGSIALKGIEELTDEDRLPTVEKDPLQEAVSPGIEPHAPRIEPVAGSPEVRAVTTQLAAPSDNLPISEQDVTTDVTEPYARLFGVLWPQTAKVKLDPTVDRETFRAQRDALKTLGFKFQPLGQLWVKE